jgi:RHS repeat-associated protein
MIASAKSMMSCCFLTLSCGRARATNYPFLTQKERDVETVLDYFGARYYGAVTGRFCSPDNFLNDIHVSNPQSWNLYSYVRNSPLNYIDPTGEVVDGTDLSSEEASNSSRTGRKKGYNVDYSSRR